MAKIVCAVASVHHVATYLDFHVKGFIIFILF